MDGWRFTWPRYFSPHRQQPETWRKPTNQPTNQRTNERMNEIDEMIQRIEEEHTVPGKIRHTTTHSYIHPCIGIYILTNYLTHPKANRLCPFSGGPTPLLTGLPLPFGFCFCFEEEEEGAGGRTGLGGGRRPGLVCCCCCCKSCAKWKSSCSARSWWWSRL